jgi:hypothetical protein
VKGFGFIRVIGENPWLPLFSVFSVPSVVKGFGFIRVIGENLRLALFLCVLCALCGKGFSSIRENPWLPLPFLSVSSAKSAACAVPLCSLCPLW